MTEINRSPAQDHVCTGQRQKTERLKFMLRRYRLLQGEITDLTRQLQAVKLQEEDLTLGVSAGYDSPIRGKGEHSDPTFLMAERMIEVYQRKSAYIRRQIVEMTAERAQVDELMELLSPREHEIVKLRWINGLSWTAVARKLFLCERQCQRVSERALTRMTRNMADLPHGYRGANARDCRDALGG